MSYGQNICKNYLTRLVPEAFQENYRPEWLFGMELDFFFPDTGVAVEFNGDQHYFSTVLAPDVRPQKRRDARKKALCKENGIVLITVKAIDLVSHKMRHKLKRLFALNPNGNIKHLDHEAKLYRKMLIERFNSPTAHRNKGRSRAKTVQKLFSQHPPDLSGRWNNDVFTFKRNEWIKQHGDSPESRQLFIQTFKEHLRKRQLAGLSRESYF
jgi:hypothetical protein